MLRGHHVVGCNGSMYLNERCGECYLKRVYNWKKKIVNI